MNRLVKAQQSIQRLEKSLAELLYQSANIGLSTNMKAQMMKGAIHDLKEKIGNDKLLNDYMMLAQQNNTETLLSELAIRVELKVKEYMKMINKVATDLQSLKHGFMLKSHGMGSFWDVLDEYNPFSSKDQTTLDRESGLRILRAYYDEARKYSGFPYSTFVCFLSWAERGTPFATDVGELVRNNALVINETEAIQNVRRLAQTTNGVPNISQIMQVSGYGDGSINWGSFVKQVSVATAGDIAESSVEVLQDVGDVISATGQGILSTGKFLKYLPWILIGGGVIYLTFIYGPMIKSVSKKLKSNPRIRRLRNTKKGNGILYSKHGAADIFIKKVKRNQGDGTFHIDYEMDGESYSIDSAFKRAKNYKGQTTYIENTSGHPVKIHMINKKIRKSRKRRKR